MKISEKWLAKQDACSSGVEWFKSQKETDGGTLVKTLVPEHSDWADWLIAHLLSRKQKIQYAIFAAEQVIGIYEKKYPKDDRPRKAIVAAKTYLHKPNAVNKKAAYAASRAAAYAASRAAAYAYAAHAAYAAAYAYAAYAAADAAAAYAAYAAYAASDAASDAAYAAAHAAMKMRIILYGVSLLERGKG